MFRWKRGLLHALIPFALVIVAGGVLAVATHPADAEKLGEGTGRFAMFAFFAGLGISYLVQTNRRRAALWTGISLVVLVGAVTAALIGGSKTHGLRRLQPGDREPLVEEMIGAEHRLRHPTFGFSILRPPPSYKTSSTMVAAMTGGGKSDPGTTYYAYAEDPARGGLLIGLMNDAGGSKETFGSAIAGIRRGLEQSAGKLGGATKLGFVRDDISGNEPNLEAHLHAVVAGVHLQLNAFQVRSAAGVPGIATLMVVGQDPAVLADVLTSLRR